MENVENIIYNLTGYPLRLIVASLLVIAIAWFISQNAKNIIPKLIFSSYRFYLVFAYPIMSFYTLIGIGLILPHIPTVTKYIVFQFLIIKRLSINSYVFFLTIYYKLLNLFKWIASFFKSLFIFFTTFDFRKAKNSYEKENPKEDFNQQYESYYKQEEFYKSDKSKTYQQENNQNRYKEEKKEEETYQEEQTIIPQENKNEKIRFLFLKS